MKSFNEMFSLARIFSQAVLHMGPLAALSYIECLIQSLISEEKFNIETSHEGIGSLIENVA